MSTRCNIILKDKYDKILFYRHSDGYPESVIPSLSIFMKWLQNGQIRSNVEQCSGWIVALGIKEYSTYYEKGEDKEKEDLLSPDHDWKIGAYEISTCIHGDIEYLYTVDLEKLTIQVQEVNYIKKMISGNVQYIHDFKTIDLIDFSGIDKRPVFGGVKL